MSATPTPRWVWGLLAAAVLGVSSAGALFQHVDAIPPLLRASWRLQLTSLVLLPLFLYQWRSVEEQVKEPFFSRRTWALLLGSGAALARRASGGDPRLGRAWDIPLCERLHSGQVHSGGPGVERLQLGFMKRACALATLSSVTRELAPWTLRSHWAGVCWPDVGTSHFRTRVVHPDAE